MAKSSAKFSAVGESEEVELLESGKVNAEDEFANDALLRTEAVIRLGFLRKVYGILAVQLTVTVALTAFMMLTPTVSAFIVQHPGTLWLSYFLSIGLLIALHFKKDHHPTNMYLLGAWTLALGYVVGCVCCSYNEAGLGEVVLQALFLTATIVIGLTLYTLQSKRDFSFLGGGLFACVWILIFGSFLSWFFPMSDTVHTLYAAFGAVVFSLYIIYDTYMISQRYSPDEYIMVLRRALQGVTTPQACVDLYLDIVNLFLYILQLLAAAQRD